MLPPIQHTILFNNNETPLALDTVKNKKALHILRAINHPLRLSILQLIDVNKRMTVTEIHTHFKIEQAIASQHLAILRRAGFVSTKKESKFVYYTLSYHFIQHFSKTIEVMVNS